MRRRRLRYWLVVAAIYAITAAFLFPIGYLALTALRPPRDVFAVLSAGLRFSVRNFGDALFAWEGVRIPASFLNSAVIATASTLGSARTSRSSSSPITEALRC